MTLKEIQRLCLRAMNQLGYVRLVCRTRQGDFSPRHPDALYARGSEVLALEILTSGAKLPDVLRGIGQCALFSAYRLQPYLVLNELTLHQVWDQIRLLPWLGVGEYSWNPTRGNTLELRKHPERDLGSLLPLPTLTMVGGLTRAMVWRVLKQHCPEKTVLNLDDLVNWLQDEYPAANPYKPVVARLLSSMGFDRFHAKETGLICSWHAPVVTFFTIDWKSPMLNNLWQ